MQNIFLYATTVLIWGSTWFAIEFQLGEVPVEVSLVYRFALAAAIILVISKLSGLNLKFNVKQHFFMALLGLLNFSMNYVTLYHAQAYFTSAMTSIGFSMLLLINIVNTRIFFGKKIETKTYFGAALGIFGIVVLFWPEVSQFESNSGVLTGAILVLSGTLIASLGNMVSVRNSNNDLPVFQTSGWGMLYGTIFLTIAAMLNGATFTISYEPSYLISLGYLSIFGTVIAFYSYFMLLKNIGPERASYSIVLFPVVAVILSSLYEGFEWNIFTIGGFLFVASGNLLVLTPLHKLTLLWEKCKCLPKKSAKNPSESTCIPSKQFEPS
ncbi:EamA family transporter [Aliikangiella marina]|uniref:EamA family transporter n=1 Tax=Aliikangiella marina TaxID=1712262 RepID=A0A545TH53_9GAMM|nr:EamA family transporter [Aliikangiella marina]TQV76564.1 EamA family transporter [Aliikangiella marina]